MNHRTGLALTALTAASAAVFSGCGGRFVKSSTSAAAHLGVHILVYRQWHGASGRYSQHNCSGCQRFLRQRCYVECVVLSNTMRYSFAYFDSQRYPDNVYGTKYSADQRRDGDNHGHFRGRCNTIGLPYARFRCHPSFTFCVGEPRRGGGDVSDHCHGELRPGKQRR